MLQGSLSKMDGVSTAGGFYGMNPTSSPFLGLIAHSYYFIVGAGAIPARLILRHNLGERAFSPFAFILSIGFFFWYGIIPDMDGKNYFLPGGVAGNFLAFQYLDPIISNNLWIIIPKLLLWNIVFNPYILFLLFIIYLGYHHFKDSLKKISDGKTHYSYYRGDPNFNLQHKLGKKKWGFVINDRFIRMVSEPSIIVRIGLIISFITLGIWLFLFFQAPLEGSSVYFYILFGWAFNFGIMLAFSGFCLFLEEVGIAMRIRGAALDVIDGEYDMAFIMKTTAELTAKKSETKPSSAEEIFKESEPISSVAFAGFYEESENQVEHGSQTSEIDLLREKLKAKFLQND